jgi:hypothetical protein
MPIAWLLLSFTEQHVFAGSYFFAVLFFYVVAVFANHFELECVHFIAHVIPFLL